MQQQSSMPKQPWMWQEKPYQALHLRACSHQQQQQQQHMKQRQLLQLHRAVVLQACLTSNSWALQWCPPVCSQALTNSSSHKVLRREPCRRCSSNNGSRGLQG
jgi:hypothetical protein